MQYVVSGVAGRTVHVDICPAFKRNQYLITIALDIKKKAYNMV